MHSIKIGANDTMHDADTESTYILQQYFKLQLQQGVYHDAVEQFNLDGCHYHLYCCWTEPYFVRMLQVIQPGVVLQNLSSEIGFLLSLSSFLHAHMEIAKSNGPAVLITIISQDKGCLCVVLKNRILTQNASLKELNQI